MHDPMVFILRFGLTCGLVGVGAYLIFSESTYLRKLASLISLLIGYVFFHFLGELPNYQKNRWLVDIGSVGVILAAIIVALYLVRKK